MVDDEPLVLRAAARALGPLGLEIDIASSPEEALKHIAIHDYAVVAVDLGMQAMHGLELIYRIQQQHPYTMFVIVNGQLEDDPAGLLVSETIASLIYKPWEPQELAGALNRALEMGRLRRNRMESPKVLFVEDDPDYTDVVAEQLARTDWPGSLVPVPTLQEALSALSLEPYSAILLDLNLPDASELSGLAAIQQRAPGVPVVVLSGCHDESLALRAVHGGAQDYLFKGVANGNELRRAIGFAIERREMMQRISRLVHFDQLTNLPNRRLCHDHLHRAISRARAARSGAALLVVDIDRFHLINEERGHAVADRMLRDVAARIQHAISETQCLARIGADEFGVVIEHENPGDKARDIAMLISAALAEPMVLGKQPQNVTLSIGIALFPENGTTTDDILQCAEQAMHVAKTFRGTAYHFYSAEDHARELHDQQMERALRTAVERNELRLAYQAQFRLADQQLIGFEALLRWRHRTASISPNDFVPLLERGGMIHKVGRWVLKEACRQKALWNCAGLPTARIAVNVSAHELESPDFVEHVMEAINDTGLSPTSLELELTEGVLIANLDATVRILKRLGDFGVRIAVDDFGTGYSSLVYLKRLPIHALKIDRSFVADIGKRTEAEAICKGVIGLAHALGLEVIGEGVETAEQLDFLRDCGCDAAQGYLLGYPASASLIVPPHTNVAANG